MLILIIYAASLSLYQKRERLFIRRQVRCVPVYALTNTTLQEKILKLIYNTLEVRERNDQYALMVVLLFMKASTLHLNEVNSQQAHIQMESLS